MVTERSPLLNSHQSSNSVSLHSEDDTIQTLYGYEKCWIRTTVTYIGIFISCGLLLLFFHWQPYLKIKATHKRCPLSKASKIHIRENYQNKYKTDYIKDVKDCYVTSDDDNAVEGNEYAVNQKRSVTAYFDDGSKKSITSYRLFNHKKNSFVWDSEKNCFLKMTGIEKATLCSEFHHYQGYSATDQKIIQTVYGFNEISVPVQTVSKLFILEFFNPFYMFQLFTIVVWLNERYYYYCVAIVIISTIGIVTSIIQTRKNQKNLKQTVEFNDKVQVCRDKNENTIETINSEDLVPGDLMIIPANGCTMHVDAVLLNGSCIVNESMLTGESIPLTKTAIPHQPKLYNIKDDAHHTLYCGTKIIQTRYYSGEYVRALVLRTGFQTTKGQLVRSIMYPTPTFFKFDHDSYWFIVILTVIASIGSAYSIAIKSGQNSTLSDIIIKTLDIFTIVIPPALPAAMTLGRLYTLSRLRKNDIYCIEPRVINVCGSVTCVCFDKTGTLTEDGLDIWGVVPVSFWCEKTKRNSTALSHHPNDYDQDDIASNTDIEINEIRNVSNYIGTYIDIAYDGASLDNVEVCFTEPIKLPSSMTNNDMFKIGLTACHSLTMLDGELMGDPLEIKMFESTNWILEEPIISDTSKFDLLPPTIVKPVDSGENLMNQEWGIVKSFQFSSSLQRSSVICKSLTLEHYICFTKGSPEMIKALSRPETVPKDLKSILQCYTQQGYRVLAMACKPLQNVNYLATQKLLREDIECELTFLGLIVMENKLKVETEPVIKELQQANIKVVMITGDNLDTAVSVASECGILQAGEKLIICDAAESEDKISPPALYFTSSIINVQGLKMSHTDPNNMPKLSKIPLYLPNGTSPDLYMSSSQESIELGSNNFTDNHFRLAMDGKTWCAIREHYPQLVNKIATRGIIFARMSSHQKQELVREFQSLGYYVAMCGDGANDCEALKAAHVGISVSGDESSVASPFTSKESNIRCVPKIIQEGRAALTTSFGMFKLIVTYSLTEFLSVAILYYYNSNLTDFQFLFIDVVLILSFASVFGKTQAYPGKLYNIPPGTSLLGFVPIISMILQCVTVLSIQLISLFIMQSFEWYRPHKSVHPTDYESFDNYAVFSVSAFQYIILAIVFSRGYPYRKSIFTNYVFFTCIVLLTALCIFIVVYPAEWLRSLLELDMPPSMNYRYIILGLGFANLVVSLFFEKVIVEYLMQKKKILPEKLQENPDISFLHHSVEKQIRKEKDWPPLSTVRRKSDAKGKVDNINESKRNNVRNQNNDQSS